MSYDTLEAARLISWSNKQAGVGPLSEAELIRWIDDGVGLLEWEDVWDDEGEDTKYIDFPTLISLRMICLLRSQGASLEEVKEAAIQLKEQLGVDRPFATEHLWSSYNSQPPTYPELKQIGRRDWERNYSKFFRDHKLRLRIDANLEYGQDGVAYAWSPVKDVVIDARVVSGSPCILGTRTPTWVFPGMLEGGDSIEILARGYRLSREQVWNALKWEEQLAGTSV